MTARLFEAHSLEALGRAEQAEAAFQALLQLEPGHAGAAEALARLRLKRAGAIAVAGRKTARARRAKTRPRRAAGPRPVPSARGGPRDQLPVPAREAPVLSPAGRPEDVLQLPARLAEVASQLGRAEEARAAWEEVVALSSEPATPAVRLERYRALAVLGRFREAFREAEAVLSSPDASDADKDALFNPWPNLRSMRDGRAAAQYVPELEALRGDRSCGPWPYFFLHELKGFGAEASPELRAIARFRQPRYGPIMTALARHLLWLERFDEVESAASAAGGQWKAQAYAAEALLCAGRADAAVARMAEARRLVRPFERGEALAWSGELLLWCGRYAEAEELLDAAIQLDAPFASCWRGACRYKRGDPRAALRDLDAGLERYPRDLEAFAWRGEVRRVLGRRAEALSDLHAEALRGPFEGRLSMPHEGKVDDVWCWHLLNRALTRADAGDTEGMKADARLLPWAFRRELPRDGAGALRRGLESLLERAKGCRRWDPYTWPLWRRA